MKKKFSKKLVLKKETISTISNDAMDSVRGGASFILPSCRCSESCSFIYYCCKPGDEEQNNIDIG